MRRGFGILGLIATVILLAVVGVVAYNIGWSDGVNTHLPEGVTAAPYYYGYGPHLWGAGFGIFGLLFFLVVLFFLFGLLRVLFFGRRMMMGSWGYGRGFYGGGPGHGRGMPAGVEERMQEWHRRAHGEAPPAGSGATPPPPTDQRTV